MQPMDPLNTVVIQTQRKAYESTWNTEKSILGCSGEQISWCLWMAAGGVSEIVYLVGVPTSILLHRKLLSIKLRKLLGIKHTTLTAST